MKKSSIYKAVNKQSAFLLTLLLTCGHAHGAEIGVFEGDTTEALLAHLPELELLICVDPFERYPAFDASTPKKEGKVATADLVKVKAAFKDRIAPYSSKCNFMNEYSSTAASAVPSDFLDFVFIDGNHAYEYVKEDIQLWAPKVKPGGLIVGHDYVAKPGYGVIQAVNEMFSRFYVDRKSTCWYVVKEKI